MMTDRFASTVVMVLGAVAILALVSMEMQSRRTGLSSRQRAAWRLAGWSVLSVVGFAIWAVAHQMVR